MLDGGPFDFAQGAWAKAFASVDAVHRITFASRIAMQFLEDFLGTRPLRLRSGSLDGAKGAWAGLEGFYDFGGFVKVWEGQFFCKAVVHFGCGFGFHGDAGQDRDVEFL